MIASAVLAGIIETIVRQESNIMIHVVLVDDHVVVRSGFAQLLSLEDDLNVTGQYSSAAEARSALLHDDVSVAVMDIAMPDENGLSLLKRLRAQSPVFAPSFSAFMTRPRLCKARWTLVPAVT